MKHTLKKLPYEYDSLEPYIDKETMIIHHSKHHQGYVDKLNIALEKYPGLQEKTTEELLENLNEISEKIKTEIINNCGGVVNHNFFWEVLKKETELNGKVLNAIEERFESFEKFKEEFSGKALGLFGSGWVWLVLDNGKLGIITTKNQDSPLSIGKTPLLCLDVWEHAYYLKYQNKKSEYVKAFFNIINWDKVNENFLNENKK